MQKHQRINQFRFGYISQSILLLRFLCVNAACAHNCASLFCVVPALFSIKLGVCLHFHISALSGYSERLGTSENSVPISNLKVIKSAEVGALL